MTMNIILLLITLILGIFRSILLRLGFLKTRIPDLDLTGVLFPSPLTGIVYASLMTTIQIKSTSHILHSMEPNKGLIIGCFGQFNTDIHWEWSIAISSGHPNFETKWSTDGQEERIQNQSSNIVMGNLASPQNMVDVSRFFALLPPPYTLKQAMLVATVTARTMA